MRNLTECPVGWVAVVVVVAMVVVVVAFKLNLGCRSNSQSLVSMAPAMKLTAAACSSEGWRQMTGWIKHGVWGVTHIMLKAKEEDEVEVKQAMKKAMKKAAMKQAMKKAMKKQPMKKAAKKRAILKKAAKQPAMKKAAKKLKPAVMIGELLYADGTPKPLKK